MWILSKICDKIWALLNGSTRWDSPVRTISPEGRPGMSDVSPLSGISGLSFDSTFLSPLLFFYLVFLLFLSCLSAFCRPFSWLFSPQKYLQKVSKRTSKLYLPVDDERLYEHTSAFDTTSSSGKRRKIDNNRRKKEDLLSSFTWRRLRVESACVFVSSFVVHWWVQFVSSFPNLSISPAVTRFFFDRFR